jgi:hypothetical protein
MMSHVTRQQQTHSELQVRSTRYYALQAKGVVMDGGLESGGVWEGSAGTAGMAGIRNKRGGWMQLVAGWMLDQEIRPCDLQT